MVYSTQAITAWIRRYFPVDGSNRGELQFACPKCGHDRFYFNSSKSIGFCHRAKCRYSPTIRDLIEKIGIEPSETDCFTINQPLVVPKTVVMPEGCIPTLSPGQPPIVNDEVAFQWLVRRNLTPYDILRFNIQSNLNRIYVPVIEDDVLVNYVGRLKEGCSHPLRYQYATGVPTTNYLFGWNECRLWKKLTLVENTFNGIWLRNSLFCTTNFGSHLSAIQIAKITNSKIRTVVLLWDEGAELSAEKAVKRLRGAGVNALYLRIKGQPDNYELQELKEKAILGHEAAAEGKTFL